jgi:hypothetical protein
MIFRPESERNPSGIHSEGNSERNLLSEHP